MIAGTGILAWQATDLPDLDEAIAATRRPAVTIIAANGRELATSGDLFGVPVQVDDLAPAVPLAVMAIEDRRFRDHWGIDIRGLVRAVWANLQAGGIVQGGSTITQQVAKNLFLTHERTIKRKLQEFMLALWLEHRFTKDQILALYLNRAYFGAGAYGIDAAARKYFGVPATRVSTYQAAVLAGLLRAPSRYNPHADGDLADRRARQVLNSMVEAGFMTAAEAKAAYAHKGQRVATSGPNLGSRWFVDWILDQVPHFVSAGDRDLIVTTTFDPRLQAIAEASVRSTLQGPAADAGAGQAALVVVTADGAVRAMVGGRDYGESEYNRAVQALRQPGSAFKPIVYTAALESGYRPETVVVDEPVNVNGWRPKNFNGRYAGEVTLSEALARSLNTVAVRVSEQVGRDHVLATAERLGITTDLPSTPSLALGVGEVTLLDLTASYAVFANGGFGVWPHGIVAIHDASGRLLYERAGNGPGRVLEPWDAADMTRMLMGVVRHGTGHAAQLRRPTAGKTGTSQNHRDAWFIGFTPEIVTGVWIGNDDGTAMRRVTGGGLPAKLWRAFADRALAGQPVRSFAHLSPVRPRSAPTQTADARDRDSLLDLLLEVLPDE